MKNKILIPLVILAVLAGFFSFRYSGGDEQIQEQRQALILQTVINAMEQGHFDARAVDDSFSKKVFTKALTTLDYEKKFFTQEDVDRLAQYQYQIDDQIKAGSIDFFAMLDTIFQARIDDAEKYYQEILKQPFSFDVNEEVVMNGEKLDYAADKKALKERWRKVLKYRVLARYVDAKKSQEKTDSATTEKEQKSDVALEAEARESIEKNQDRFFKRLRKLNQDERFALFVNSVTNIEDPHTEYMPPKDKQRFDEYMSGTFFGIGAQLKDEDGKIKVAAIIAGSPCWKQGELEAEDEIIKVAQGEKEPVDIQGFDIEDAVKLIRGDKGTEVRLTVKKVNGATDVIPIIRGEVLLEEVFAKSAIIKSPHGAIGYIYLPEFYSDFQNINGRRSGEDVTREVLKLKNAGVAGIILDLRNNGGGSLSDVVEMSGIFIDEGPIVQVKSNHAAPMLLHDKNKGILYNGPLAIMVNQNSASASEILAAAMQDYKRAVIIGSTTFGKGTVQKIVSLDEFMKVSARLGQAASNITGLLGSESGKPIGSLKLTVQKFYRINGGSTQLKGVEPDINLPDPYEYIKMGERRDKAALKWDEIAPAEYEIVDNPVNVAKLKALSKKRVEANPTFDLIRESALRMKQQQDDNSYSLNEEAFRKKLEEANATAKKMEALEEKHTPFEIVNLKEDLPRVNLDSSTVEKNKQWLNNVKKDIYVTEAVNIVGDMTKLNVKVSMGSTRE